MLFRCPDCGKVKYYNSWKVPDERMRRELAEWQDPVNVRLVKCPACKVKVTK